MCVNFEILDTDIFVYPQTSRVAYQLMFSTPTFIVQHNTGSFVPYSLQIIEAYHIHGSSLL